MKKRGLLILMILILALASSSSIFGASPSLMSYPLSSPVYSWIEELYVLEGMATPNMAKPWTEVDLDHLLERVKPSSEVSWSLYDEIKSSIQKKKGAIQGYLDLYLDLNFLFHSNPDSFNTFDRIVEPLNLSSRFAGIGLGFSHKEYFALYVDFGLGTELPMVEDYKSPYPSSPLYSWYMGSNIPGAPDLTFDWNLPERLYLIAGFDAFRISIARDRLSWGPGIMGNMLLGNTLPFHDYISFDYTGSPWFSYTFLLDFMTNEENFGNDYSAVMHGLRLLIAHRFAFSLFKGKFNFAINDSLMYSSQDFFINPVAFLPLFLLHSVANPANNNNLVTLEVEWAAIKGLSLYAEGAVDDLSLGSRREDARVEGWALSAGATGVLPFRNGLFKIEGEFVYATPFMWHKNITEFDPDALGSYEQNQYFVSSLRYYVMWDEIKGIFEYLSYPFGSDAFAGLLRFGYEVPGLWKASFDAFLMAHGVIGKFSPTGLYEGDGSKKTSTPSTINPFDRSECGPAEYTLVIGGSASWRPRSYLELSSFLYLFGLFNDRHVASPFKFDIQGGISIKLFY